MKDKKWTLTTTELAAMQRAAFDLGRDLVLDAARALYKETKAQNIEGAMKHEGHELNNQLITVLLLTDEGRSLLPAPHPE